MYYNYISQIIMVSLGVISMASCNLMSNHGMKSFPHVSFLKFGNKLEELLGVGEHKVFVGTPKISPEKGVTKLLPYKASYKYELASTVFFSNSANHLAFLFPLKYIQLEHLDGYPSVLLIASKRS